MQKRLSHFGAVRVHKDRLLEKARGGQMAGNTFFVNMRELTASVAGDGITTTYFLATEDVGNNTYAAWLEALAGSKMSQIPTRSIESMGDVVEAALGVCYLGCTFPSLLDKVINRPNEMWRRIETSIMSRNEWVPSLNVSTAKRHWAWDVELFR